MMKVTAGPRHHNLQSRLLTLGVHQLDGFEVVYRRPPVVVAESALQRDVVVLHTPAHEVVLGNRTF